MKKTIAAAVGLFLGLVMQANASKFTQFTFTGNGGDGTIASGLLDLTDNGNNTYTATSGSIDIFAGTGFSGNYSLIPNLNGTAPSYLSIFIYDDQVFPNLGPDGYVNNNGLLFGNGSFWVNLFSQSGSPYLLYGSSWENHSGTMNLTFSIGNSVSNTAVPDGGMTAMLLGMGMMGLGCLRTCFGKK